MVTIYAGDVTMSLEPNNESIPLRRAVGLFDDSTASVEPGLVAGGEEKDSLFYQK
jgi:hypothetical protein